MKNKTLYEIIEDFDTFIEQSEQIEIDNDALSMLSELVKETLAIDNQSSLITEADGQKSIADSSAISKQGFVRNTTLDLFFTITSILPGAGRFGWLIGADLWAIGHYYSRSRETQGLEAAINVVIGFISFLTLIGRISVGNRTLQILRLGIVMRFHPGFKNAYNKVWNTARTNAQKVAAGKMDQNQAADAIEAAVKGDATAEEILRWYQIVGPEMIQLEMQVRTVSREFIGKVLGWARKLSTQEMAAERYREALETAIQRKLSADEIKSLDPNDPKVVAAIKEVEIAMTEGDNAVKAWHTEMIDAVSEYTKQALGPSPGIGATVGRVITLPIMAVVGLIRWPVWQALKKASLQARMDRVAAQNALEGFAQIKTSKGMMLKPIIVNGHRGGLRGTTAEVIPVDIDGRWTQLFTGLPEGLAINSIFPRGTQVTIKNINPNGMADVVVTRWPGALGREAKRLKDMPEKSVLELPQVEWIRTAAPEGPEAAMMGLMSTPGSAQETAKRMTTIFDNAGLEPLKHYSFVSQKNADGNTIAIRCEIYWSRIPRDNPLKESYRMLAGGEWEIPIGVLQNFRVGDNVVATTWDNWIGGVGSHGQGEGAELVLNRARRDALVDGFHPLAKLAATAAKSAGTGNLPKSAGGGMSMHYIAWLRFGWVVSKLIGPFTEGWWEAPWVKKLKPSPIQKRAVVDKTSPKSKSGTPRSTQKDSKEKGQDSDHEIDTPEF